MTFQEQQLRINAAEAGLTVKGYLKSGLKSDGISTKRSFGKKPVRRVKTLYGYANLPF